MLVRFLLSAPPTGVHDSCRQRPSPLLSRLPARLRRLHLTKQPQQRTHHGVAVHLVFCHLPHLLRELLTAPQALHHHIEEAVVLTSLVGQSCNTHTRHGAAAVLLVCPAGCDGTLDVSCITSICQGTQWREVCRCSDGKEGKKAEVRSSKLLMKKYA